MPRVSSKNQVTLPVEALRIAGIGSGDEVTIRAAGDGQLIVAARQSRIVVTPGSRSGIYEPEEIERLRDEWRR